MAAKFVVAIDLGGTNLKIALVDLGYRIIRKRVLATRRFRQKELLIKAILDSTRNIIRDNGLSKKDIQALSLGLPGPIDLKKGIVHFFPNIPGWKEVRLKRILEKRLGLKVFMDNDAKLMTLAEYKFGRGKNYKNVVCLTLGTGVGGGMIIEGRLYRGFNNASAEIGHLPINEKGPRCNCGGRGCLEAYIGNQRILKLARQILKRDVTLEEASELARKRNPRALKLWSRIARHLGRALVGIVNILNPDCIILGGGVASAGETLFSGVSKVIATQAMSVQASRVKLYKAKLGSDAGLIGAAILAREKAAG